MPKGRVIIATFDTQDTAYQTEEAMTVNVYIVQHPPELNNIVSAMISTPSVNAPENATPMEEKLTQRPTFAYEPPPMCDHMNHTMGAPEWLDVGTGINVTVDGLLPGQRYSPHTYPSHGITSAEDFELYVGRGDAKQMLLDSKHDAVVLAIESWVAGGKAKYMVQLKDIPTIMTELDVIDWVRQFGYVQAFLMNRAPYRPSLTDGTAMVKFHSVRDANNLLSAAPATMRRFVERPVCMSPDTGALNRATGRPSDEISAHLTRVEFVTPAGIWRKQCGFKPRYCGGARHNHFGEFSEETLMQDEWLTEKMDLSLDHSIGESDSESELVPGLI